MSRPIDRRAFLRRGVVGAGAIGLAPHLAAFETPGFGSQRTDARRRILVVIQLTGGNDGLSTIVPFDDDDYRAARPNLQKRAQDCTKIAVGLGLNGKLEKLGCLFKKGRLAIVQGVGYPGPSRSHFKSMEVWHSADPSGKPKTYGWLGKLADELYRRHARSDIAINLAATTPLALAGRLTRPISFERARRLRFVGSEHEIAAYERLTEPRERSRGALDFIAKTAEEARRVSRDVRGAVEAYRTPREYPTTPIGRRLHTVAGLIAGGLSTQIYYACHDGFDTHAAQAHRHDVLLAQLDDALAAFYGDLERLDAARKVAILVFSEFGRRLTENAAGGTDHGTAAPSFVLGGKVNGGLYGKSPSLADADLEDGDPKFNVDFRSIYASIISDWIRADSTVVLGEKFDRLPLFG